MNIKSLFLFFMALAGFGSALSGQTDMQIDPSLLAPAQEKGIWLQPAAGTKAQPVWGFSQGIRIGIAPLGGPRGLIRIYTPYLDQPEFDVMNYIAFEPVDRAGRVRGLSELEPSALDRTRGKRFWSSDTPEPPSFPDLYYPAQGVIANENGLETLTVYLFCEKFDNGAEVYVRIRFTEGKPHEFELTAYTTTGSAPLDRLILTATMGNKARLRQLHLAGGRTKESLRLWPDYREAAFTAHDHTPLAEMIRDTDGGAWFVASPDEENPAEATYANDTHEHWKYIGRKATQYWYCARPEPQLEGVVNGRYAYWASRSPIPGGIAYENFELTQPFRQGQSYVFGISPDCAGDFIRNIEQNKIRK